jgi:hypothetical protein
MTLFQRIRAWWRGLPHGLRVTLVTALTVLILARLALPYALKAFVNHQLAHGHGYSGRVGGITVHLWRGAYRIHEIHIYKTSGHVREPFFEAAYIDLSVEWLQLLRGAVVGKVYMLEPKINFVAGPTQDQSQTGAGGGWSELLSGLFPFRLNRLETRDGSVYFLNDYSKPKVDIFMKELDLVATNLTNSENQKQELPARVQATAKTIGSGAVDIQVKLNPLDKDPTFELTGIINGMDLTAANSFIKAYGGFQANKGIFSAYATVASKDGNYDGYLKIFFKNLNVFALGKEGKKDILQVFWDAIVGATTAVLTNPNGTLATKVPISGSYGQNHVGVWQAIGSVLQNAFIRALLPKFDETITLKNVENKLHKNGGDSKKDQEKAAPTQTPSPQITPTPTLAPTSTSPTS